VEAAITLVDNEGELWEENTERPLQGEETEREKGKLMRLHKRLQELPEPVVE
jgi:hypothetical protein